MHSLRSMRRRRAVLNAGLAALVTVSATACRAPYTDDGRDYRQLDVVDLVPGDASNVVPATATSFVVRLTPAAGRVRALDNFVGIGGADSYRWNEPDGGANAVPGIEVFLAEELLATQPTPAFVDVTVDVAKLRASGVATTAGDHTLCVVGAIRDTAPTGRNEYFPWRHCDTVRFDGEAPAATPTTATPTTATPTTAVPTTTATPTTAVPTTTAAVVTTTSVTPTFVPVPEPPPAIRPAGSFGAVSLANDADGDSTFNHHEQAASAGALVPVRFTVQNPGTISLFVQSISVVVDGVPQAAPDCDSWVGATVDPTHGFTCNVQVAAAGPFVTRTVEAVVNLSQMSAPFGAAASADTTEFSTR